MRVCTRSRGSSLPRARCFARHLAATLTDPVDASPERGHARGIDVERGGPWIEGGLEDRYGAQAVSLKSSRPISMRRISLVPAPIS